MSLTLEDVFLHYTGRTIREDSGKELHGMSAAQKEKNSVSEIRGFYTLWLREIKRFLSETEQDLSPVSFSLFFGLSFLRWRLVHDLQLPKLNLSTSNFSRDSWPNTAFYSYVHGNKRNLGQRIRVHERNSCFTDFAA